MAKQTAERIAEANAEALTKNGQAEEKFLMGTADAEIGNVSRATVALSKSTNASRAAVQELTKAYQELAAKNVSNLTAAMQRLAAAKSPTEFIELQKRLISEGVEAAVKDSQHIAQLTTAVFAAAFESVKAQIGGVAEERPELTPHIFPTSARSLEPQSDVAVRSLQSETPVPPKVDFES